MTNQSVGEMVLKSLPATVSLTLVALVLACIIAVIFGAGPLLWRKPWFDRISTAVCSLSISMPSFWVALLLTSWFAVERHWFPALGYVGITEDPVEWLRHLILPALALGLATGGELARQLRGAVGRRLRPRLRAGVTSQGTDQPPHRPQARAEERRDPGHDHPRRADRPADRRHGHHRADLPHQRSRPAHRHCRARSATCRSSSASSWSRRSSCWS